jgi:hypothetical protein
VDSDDVGQRFRSKPDADSDARRTGEGISSIPLAVELHGRWHVMTPSIELRDGVCL